MQLKRDGALARFYKRTYLLDDDEVPRNLCNYLWGLVLAIVLLPLTAWSYAFDGTNPNRRDVIGRWGDRAFYPITVAVLCFVCIMAVALIVKAFIVAPIISAGVVVVGGGGGLFLWLSGAKRRKALAGTVEEALTVVSTQVKAFKEGYCPRIDWQ